MCNSYVYGKSVHTFFFLLFCIRDVSCVTSASLLLPIKMEKYLFAFLRLKFCHKYIKIYQEYIKYIKNIQNTES